MKVKFKLSVMMIAIMLVIVAGIALLLLRQASGMTLDLSLRGIAYLATQQAEYWKSREDGYIRAIRTLANIMADYEDTPAEIRRDRFDGMLLGTIMSEPMLVTLYTIWKPNAIDGMDDAFVGRAGSSPSGQYAMAYTREYGQLQARSSVDIENAMAYFNGSNSKKDRVDDPFFRAIGGKETRMVRIMVPIVNPRTNETVGGVGLLLDTGAIQRGLEEVIASHKEIALMAIYSNDGFILAHFLPDRIGKMMLDVDKEYGEYARAAYKAIQDGTRFRCGVYDNALETRVELVLEPFTLGTSDRSWTVLLGSAESYVLKEVNALTKFTIILAAAAIAASAAIVFFSLSYSIKPLANVINVLKDISEGEGDLTRNIAVNSKDEVGDLARYFNATLEKIKRLVAAIKGRSEALSDIGGELAGNMTETAAAVNEIAATTQSVKGRVMNQSASVSQTNAAMEQITANIDKLNRHIESQAASVSQSSSSIEEMLANIQSVTQTLAKNADNMKNLAAASDVGRAGLQNVAADIQEIAHDSEGLLEINSVMQDIASQTNLLSMNAAIEAAHAGEAGRGFAVVADEIRKLAENSGGQSKTIGAVLKKITSSIEKIMISAGGALEKFGAMDDGIKTVSEQEGLIRGAMEEQAAGSKQILEAISQVNDVTRQVKNEAAEMLQGSREVIQESGNLEKATEEIAGGMNEMASGADQINAAVVRVNELTIQNRENIESLMREVSRFKVE